MWPTGTKSLLFIHKQQQRFCGLVTPTILQNSLLFEHKDCLVQWRNNNSKAMKSPSVLSQTFMDNGGAEIWNKKGPWWSDAVICCDQYLIFRICSITDACYFVFFLCMITDSHFLSANHWDDLIGFKRDCASWWAAFTDASARCC